MNFISPKSHLKKNPLSIFKLWKVKKHPCVSFTGHFLWLPLSSSVFLPREPGGPTQEVWCGTRESAFLTSPPVMWLLPDGRPRLENYYFCTKSLLTLEGVPLDTFEGGVAAPPTQHRALNTAHAHLCGMNQRGDCCRIEMTGFPLPRNTVSGDTGKMFLVEIRT